MGLKQSLSGSPIAHFSYGLGFLFSSAGTVVGTGSLSSDVLHRIVPQWSAGLSNFAAKDKKASQNPFKMMISGAVVGAAVVTFLNTLSGLIPSAMSTIAEKIVSPSAELILSPILPVAFWISALGAGKYHGAFATIFGVLAQVIMGNATPGCVLGILVGQSVQDEGFTSKRSLLMMGFVAVMFLLIAYFRGLI